jgi:integrase
MGRTRRQFDLPVICRAQFSERSKIVPVVNMTARFLETLKPAAAAVEWFDEDTRGLSLKLNPGGAATWYYNYTRRADAMRRRVQLGKLTALPLKEARQRARKAAGLVADGKDPAGDRRAERNALSVAELAERFLAEYASAKRTGRRQRQALEKDVLPIIGRAKAAAIKRDDVARITQRMVGRGVTIGASRTFEIVRKMFNWAVANGLLEQSPCVGMKKPFPTSRRERVLSHAEILTVWEALGDDETPISRDGRDVLKLCLITGQRLGEVAGMSRDEFDFAKSIWTIPSWRSKNGHAHRVPLTDMALGIIKAALARASTEFLFPGYGKDDAMKSSSVGKAVRRSREQLGMEHWTAHDLRRTAATGMADLGVPPHVIGHVLNHRAVTQSSVTDQVYNRYTYDREKREALEKWSANLAALVSGGAAEVIALRSA